MEENQEIQEIYINMDDSGKLTKNEKYCVYGGIVFTSLNEKQAFSNKYRSIIKRIKCKYCLNDNKNCSHECPEIKSSLIDDSERRQIINLCKQHKVFSLVVFNDKIYENIMTSKASRGRYMDWTIKMTIKEIIQQLISEKIIDPNKEIKLVINIDQQTTKSNGYYNLQESLYEELAHGIINYNYSSFYSPIIHGKLNLSVYYIDSKKSIAIQAADIIAGTTRKIMYYNELQQTKKERLKKFTWVIKFFPN